MKRVRRIFSISILIAVLILACFAAALYFGKMDETVEGSGMVEPGRRIGVAPKIDGIIERVLVDEGDNVSINDTLFIMHSEETELAVKRAHNVLADARSDLRRSEEEYRNLTTSRSYELGVILADLNEAEQRMIFNKERLDRTRKLHEKGLVNTEEFERERLGYESSRSYFEVLKSRSEILKKQLERRIEEKRRYLELAESSFELAQGNLAKSIVVSPIAGVVLTPEPDNMAGTMARKGEPIVEIGCFDDYIFSAQISETDITDVDRGDSVKIFINSYPHREYKIFGGTVDRIAAVPILSKGESVFEVKILIEEPWVEEENGARTHLKYGLMGRAEIITDPSVRLYRLLVEDLSK